MSEIDKIYVVNLKRRADRKNKISEEISKLGLLDKTEFVEAVDGCYIDDKYIAENELNIFPWKYTRYHSFFKLLKLHSKIRHFYNREITPGEIGCSLSHLKIWQKIKSDNCKNALILEDDSVLAIEPEIFHSIVDRELQNLTQHNYNWDMLYLGRSPLTPDIMRLNENLVKPGYSWGSHAYMLSQSGAEKLLVGDIKQNLIPVDEYLSAMFNCNFRPEILKLLSKYEKLETLSFFPSFIKQRTEDESSDIEVYDEGFVKTFFANLKSIIVK